MNAGPALRAQNISTVVIVIVVVALGLVAFFSDVDQSKRKRGYVDRDEKQSKHKDSPFI
jgi:hypothetical protein